MTNTLIDLAQNKSKVIYWTIGRREYNFTDVNVYNGASLAAQTLRQCNFELRELDHFTKVPQDCGAANPIFNGRVRCFKRLFAPKAWSYFTLPSAHL